MIIKISNPPDGLLDNATNFLAMENIVRGFGEAKHFVIGDRSIFKNIAKNSDMSRQVRNWALAVDRYQVEGNSLLRYVNFYVECDFSKERATISWTFLSGESCKLIVSPDFFTDTSSIQKVKIICENIIDSEFYEIMARDFIRSKLGGSQMSLSYSSINGGGGTTYSVFENEILNDELVLCILDNDKKHPNGPRGSTCSSFGSDRFKKTGFIKVIDAHEIESLIPINTIIEALKDKGKHIQKQDGIDFLHETKELSYKIYFDHKNGINIKKAIELDNLHGDFWVPALKRFNKTKGQECLNRRACSNSACQCVKIDGFGEHLLNDSLGYIKRGNMRTYSPELSPPLIPLWENIGKTFFSWSCAPARRTII